MSFWGTSLILLLCLMGAVAIKPCGETQSEKLPFEDCVMDTYMRPSDLHLNNLWELYYKLADGAERRDILQLFHLELSLRVKYLQLLQQPPFETRVLLPLIIHDVVRQPDAHLMSLWVTYMESPDEKRMTLLNEVHEEVAHRARVDTNLRNIATFLFGPEAVSSVLSLDGQTDSCPVEDCALSLDRPFKERLGCSLNGGKYCGSLDALLTNICRNNITQEKMEAAFASAGLDAHGNYAAL